MSLLQEGLFVLVHPAEALAAIREQVVVSLDIEPPPAGGTTEIFPGLPVSKAARLIKEAKEKGRGKV